MADEAWTTHDLKKKTRIYAGSYFHDNKWWTVELRAYGPEDARSRCSKLGIHLEGEISYAAPMWAPDWLSRPLCFLVSMVPPREVRWKFWHPSSGAFGGVVLAIIGAIAGGAAYLIAGSIM